MKLRVTQIDLATKQKITHVCKYVFHRRPKKLYYVIITWYLSDSFTQRDEIEKYLDAEGDVWINVFADDIDWGDMDDYLSEMFPEYKATPEYLRAIVLLFFEKNEIIIDNFIKKMYNII